MKKRSDLHSWSVHTVNGVTVVKLLSKKTINLKPVKLSNERGWK